MIKLLSDNLSLKATWVNFRQNNPMVRIRDAAVQLGVSEAALLATQQGETVTQLKPGILTAQQVLQQLSRLDVVMLLTRNDAVVHEVHHQFQHITPDPHAPYGLQLESINPVNSHVYHDLNHFHYTFAVNEKSRLSLQFFNQAGAALHKVYLLADSHFEAYHELIAQYRLAEAALSDSDLLEQAHAAPDSQSDDSQEARIPPKTHAIGEQSALSGEQLEQQLTRWAEQAIPCHISVQNQGVIQSYSGKLNKLLRTGPWFNVLDPGFNLHLNISKLKAVWSVNDSPDDLTELRALDQSGGFLSIGQQIY